MRRRWALLLALLALLVAWMALDARHRSGLAQSEAGRRAHELAERLVSDQLAAPLGQWPGAVHVAADAEEPERHAFVDAGDYSAAMQAAEAHRAWRAARALGGEVGVVDVGEPVLAQRIDRTVRVRPFADVAAHVYARTGVRLRTDGPGIGFLSGRLSTEGVAVGAVAPAPARPTGPWLDLIRALLAVWVGAMLVRDVLVAQGAREREAARQDARDRLLQRVSHELRTPAASVWSLSDALAGGAVADPEEQRQFLELIGVEAARLADGIDRLLRAARAGEVHVDPIDLDLSEWARSAAARWAARLPGLELSLPDSLPWRADPERLDEAVDALLDNAAKYGGPGVRLGVERRADTAVLIVEDDGEGVPVEDRDRVLGRMERVEGRIDDPGGYGLGLWAVAEVARAHGGELEIEGPARFAITLGDPS